MESRVGDEQRNCGSWRQPVNCRTQADHQADLRDKQEPNRHWVAVDQVQRDRSEKLDLEQSISDRLRLSDQLMQPLFGHRAVTLVVDVKSVSSAWRLSVD